MLAVCGSFTFLLVQEAGQEVLKVLPQQARRVSAPAANGRGRRRERRCQRRTTSRQREHYDGGTGQQVGGAREPTTGYR